MAEKIFEVTYPSLTDDGDPVTRVYTAKQVVHLVVENGSPEGFFVGTFSDMDGIPEFLSNFGQNKVRQVSE